MRKSRPVRRRTVDRHLRTDLSLLLVLSRLDQPGTMVLCAPRAMLSKGWQRGTNILQAQAKGRSGTTARNQGHVERAARNGHGAPGEPTSFFRSTVSTLQVDGASKSRGRAASISFEFWEKTPQASSPRCTPSPEAASRPPALQ